MRDATGWVCQQPAGRVAGVWMKHKGRSSSTHCYSCWCGAAEAVGILAEIHPSMISTLHCQEDAASLTRFNTSSGFTLLGVMSTSTWSGIRLKSTLRTPGMACKILLISASFPLQPAPLIVKGRRSLTGGVAKAGSEVNRPTARNTVDRAC